MQKVNNFFALRVTIVLFSLLICSVSSYSQTQVNKSKLDSIVEKFFNIYSTSSKEAVKFIFSMPTDISVNSRAEVQAKLSSQEKSYGKFFGYSSLITIKPCEELVLVSCLAKHEQAALRYSFIFYKPDKEWKLYNFSFDSNITSEMEEAEKIYYYDFKK